MSDETEIHEIAVSKEMCELLRAASHFLSGMAAATIDDDREQDLLRYSRACGKVAHCWELERWRYEQQEKASVGV